MKKMFVLSVVLAAAFAVGCGKKQAQQTTPTDTTKTEPKPEGSMGGDTYGAQPEGGGATPEPDAPK